MGMVRSVSLGGTRGRIVTHAQEVLTGARIIRERGFPEKIATSSWLDRPTGCCRLDGVWGKERGWEQRCLSI